MDSSEDYSSRLIVAKRTHRVIYTLMTKHYASYYELSHIYSIEEVLDMYEACLFELHNKATAFESLKQK